MALNTLTKGSVAVMDDYDVSRLESPHDTIEPLRVALSRIQKDHPDRAELLDHLAWSLDQEFQVADDFELLEEALELRRESLHLTSSSDLALYLQRSYQLAMALYGHYEESLSLDTLLEAMALMERLIDIGYDESAKDLPTRYNLLSHYTSCCVLKYKHTNSVSDIDAANEAYLQTEAALPENHRALIQLLNAHVSVLLDRYAMAASSTTLDTIFTTFQRISAAKVGPPIHQLDAVVRWASNADKYQHPSAMEAYTRAFELLPEAVWHGYGVAIRNSIIRLVNRMNLPTRAADCAIRSGRLDLAIQWLDEGRSILWAQMLKLRTPLDDLRAVQPALADQLEKVGQALESGGQDIMDEDYWDKNYTGKLQDIQKRLRSWKGDRDGAFAVQRLLVESWEQIVAHVRTLPSFANFLAPRTFDTLKEACLRGPVIMVNSMESESYALIMRQGVPVKHLALPNMTLQRVRHLLKRLKTVLDRLGRSRESSGDRHLGRSSRNCGQL